LGVHLTASLNSSEVFEKLLEGCSIKSDGKLERSKMFRRSQHTTPGRIHQALLDRAILGLVAALPEGADVVDSLNTQHTHCKLGLSGSKTLPPALRSFDNLEALVINGAQLLGTLDALRNCTVLRNLEVNSPTALRDISAPKN
jgi:hypothetical protein